MAISYVPTVAVEVEVVGTAMKVVDVEMEVTER